MPTEDDDVADSPEMIERPIPRDGVPEGEPGADGRPLSDAPIDPTTHLPSAYGPVAPGPEPS